MKLVFLGTNGWYSDKNALTVSALLETRRFNIVLDAGDGFAKLDEYAGLSKETFLFLSHFHLDHVSGLHALLKFNFQKGLFIVSPEGGKEILKSFVNSPFTFPLDNLPYKVRLIEMPADIKKIPFRVNTLPLVHSGLCLGCRIEIENKVISYCPDTAFCANAVKLAENADILIAECAFKSGEKKKGWPHLNPELAAETARKAGAKKLFLTHFDAFRYKTFAEKLEAQRAARKIFKNTFASRNGMIVEL